MPRLEALSLGKRILLAIVIVVFVVLALMLISWLVNEPAQGQELQFQHALPPKGSVDKPSRWDERLLELDREALDEAYRNQLQHLFAVWMKGDDQQPGRAKAGADQARRAYILVRQAIDDRYETLKKQQEQGK